MKKYTLIDNNIVDKDLAHISSEDRAFRFGDSTFQTVKIHNSTLYDLDSYLKRLSDASKTLKFDFNFDHDSLKKKLNELVLKNSIKNGVLRINLSRGSGSMGYLPSKKTKASLVANCYDTTLNKNNKDIIGISDTYLWDLPLEFAKIKNSRSMNYIMAKISANQKGHYDDIILTKKGEVAECSSSNIFWIKNSTIYTSSEKCGIYPGHIREKLISNKNLKISLATGTLGDIINSDEIFLTNSNILVKPIKKLTINGESYDKKVDISNQIFSYITEDLEKYCK